jgi:predicted DNA-binding transcriptional regulator YafY
VSESLVKAFAPTFPGRFSGLEGAFQGVSSMYKRGDFGPVSRALRVLDALRGFKQGRWVSEIAAELKTSERTVKRDIAELLKAGFVIRVSRRENRSYAVLKTEQTYSTVSISKSERLTLLAVRGVFDVMQGTPFLDDVRSVMKKLEQRMSDDERTDLKDFGERFVYLPDHGTKSYAGKEDIINAIQTGMVSRWVVRYEYGGTRGRARNGYLAPFGMVLYRHGLYVVGAVLAEPSDDARTATRRNFAVERFVDAEALRGQQFEMPEEFNMRSILHGAFGPHLPDEGGPHHVVVEFSREKAHLVSSRSWHPSQTIEHVAEGHVRVSFDVPNLAPVVSWVLEWGPHARAIAPGALVDEVVRELDQARAQY